MQIWESETPKSDRNLTISRVAFVLQILNEGTADSLVRQTPVSFQLGATDSISKDRPRLPQVQVLTTALPQLPHPSLLSLQLN